MKSLGRLKFGAVMYSVLIVPEDFPELEGNLGLLDPDNRKIYLSESLSPHDLRDTLIHEVAHGLLRESGLAAMLFGHLAADGREKAEEDAVRVLTPHIVDLITQMRRPMWSKRVSKLWTEEEKKS